MKRNSIWFLFLGLLLGVALGFAISAWVNRPGRPKSSALLREFSVTAVTASVGHPNWQVLEDRTYAPFPALARSPRIARRMVARAELSEAEFEKFTAEFQPAATAALAHYGAVNKAQFDLTQDSTRVIDGSPVHSRVDLPRRYYAIGAIHGVADIGYIAESGRVTVMISLVEGP
jgi:hypothetical protein